MASYSTQIKDDYSHYLSYTFLSKWLRECTFLSLGVKALIGNGNSCRSVGPQSNSRIKNLSVNRMIYNFITLPSTNLLTNNTTHLPRNVRQRTSADVFPSTTPSCGMELHVATAGPNSVGLDAGARGRHVLSQLFLQLSAGFLVVVQVLFQLLDTGLEFTERKRGDFKRLYELSEQSKGT